MFDVTGGKSRQNCKCFTQNLKNYGAFEHVCTSSDNIGLDTNAVTLSAFNLAQNQVFLYPWCLKCEFLSINKCRKCRQSQAVCDMTTTTALYTQFITGKNAFTLCKNLEETAFITDANFYTVSFSHLIG
jgi:hypothetical protein